jgi:hypothetical protein
VNQQQRQAKVKALRRAAQQCRDKGDNEEAFNLLWQAALIVEQKQVADKIESDMEAIDWQLYWGDVLKCL